jgi:hypothetical protein
MAANLLKYLQAAVGFLGLCIAFNYLRRHVNAAT